MDIFILTVIACGLTGLAVGSFLNVVIYRVPIGTSIVAPPSACPSCSNPISPRDNVPVVSWLLLRGRCRHCQVAISARYPMIEALTGILFAAVAIRFGPTWSLPAELVFVAGLVALGAVDLERYLLQRAILYPTGALVAAALVAAAALTGHWGHLGAAAICGTVAFACFSLIHFIKPGWMGFGDVRLAALLGTALGWLGPWYVVVAILAANIAGAVIGMAMMATGRATRTTAFPYGVFLGAGSVFALLVGGSIITWYSHHLIG